jgi:hypothetical protein
MNDTQRLEQLAREARARREKARATGDHAEMLKWDAAEREAFRRMPDGDEPCIGDQLRKV